MLILDEATSSLDWQAEVLVGDAMVRLPRGAHHDRDRAPPVPVRALDRTRMFDRGRVVEDGIHPALVLRPGVAFRALLERYAALADLTRAMRQSLAPDRDGDPLPRSDMVPLEGRWRSCAQVRGALTDPGQKGMAERLMDSEAGAPTGDGIR